MASFRGRSFIYNGMMSDMFGLEIISFETGGMTSVATSEREVVESYLPRRHRSVFYGVDHTQPLVFNLVAGSCRPLSVQVQSSINRWLLGQKQYAPLRIVQDDMEEYFYNALITNLEYTSFGNFTFAISATVHCDSPYAWTLPKMHRSLFRATDPIKKMTIYNDTDVLDFIYPDLTISVNTGQSKSLQIRNNTIGDNNETSFNIDNINLTNAEISVDGTNRIITSTDATFRLNDFNKRWVKLAPGNNELQFIGGVTSAVVQFVSPKIIGG